MDIKKLEAWYQKNHRDLPFRASNQPYAIWVSEIMLQQTQVETVLPYFDKFMKNYPTINDLAKAHLDDLRKSVEGLGYYRRFKLMHQAANHIMEKHRGNFPTTYEDVLCLPGVGQYTAGAIMSIAYNQPYSALDGNVIRVLSRYYGLHDDFRIQKNKNKLNHINQDIISLATPRIYTQALMELGALICRPKQPKCSTCPIQKDCVAYHQELTEKLPVLSPLNKPKEINYITLIIEDEKHVYLRKRHESLLEGMYEYPQYEAESIAYVINHLEENHIQIRCHHESTTYKHVFSHQIWNMHVYRCHLVDDQKLAWIKVKKENLMNIPMGIAHRKIKMF